MDENIHKITLDDRKVKLTPIADFLEITKVCVGYIFHEYLGLWKLYAKYVPRELTIDQKAAT